MNKTEAKKHFATIREWANTDSTLWYSDGTTWRHTFNPIFQAESIFQVVAQEHLHLWKAYLRGELQCRVDGSWEDYRSLPDFDNGTWRCKYHTKLQTKEGTVWVDKNGWAVAEDLWLKGQEYMVVSEANADVWRAWVDGATVQFLYADTWITDVGTPKMYRGTWRVQPSRRLDYVNVNGVECRVEAVNIRIDGKAV